MKKSAILLALLALLGMNLAAADAAAGPKNKNSVGLGAYIEGGYKNGISAKFWLDQQNAIDAVFSYAGGDYDYNHFHVDFLHHKYGVVKVDSGEIPVYFGIGVFVENDSTYNPNGTATNGLRIPVGFDYLLKDAPLDVYMELAPTIVSGDISGFYFSGAFGFRYYF